LSEYYERGVVCKGCHDEFLRFLGCMIPYFLDRLDRGIPIRLIKVFLLSDSALKFIQSICLRDAQI
jgi:hypothetical protein